MKARVQGFDPATGHIRVWHSSPYDFDEFSMDHLGTGDSYSTHARGQYFAEHPSIGGYAGKYWRQFHQRFSDAESVLKATGGREKAIEQIRRYLNHKQPDGYELLIHLHQLISKRLGDVLPLLENNTLDGPVVYDVSLKARPDGFLTFEKPIWYKGKEYFGKDLYKYLSAQLGEEETTIYLKDIMGIPGARYLDALSRKPGVTNQTYNYAVWDPTIIRIVGKIRSDPAERTAGEANAVI